MVSDKDAQDYNTYFIGRIHEHNMVITCLLVGVNSTTIAASVANDIVRTFKGLRFGLMIDIRDDIPNLNKGNNIRLRDVVVS
jgi:hypothetical protein